MTAQCGGQVTLATRQRSADTELPPSIDTPPIPEPSGTPALAKERTSIIGISLIRPFHGCMDSVEDPAAYIEDIEYTMEVEV